MLTSYEFIESFSDGGSLERLSRLKDRFTPKTFQQVPDHKVAHFGPMHGADGVGFLSSDVGKALSQGGSNIDFLVDGTYPTSNPLEERFGGASSVIRLSEVSPKELGHNFQYYGSLLWGLSLYLWKQEQVTLFSNGTKYNILSVWASSFVRAQVRLILVEHGLLRPRMTGTRRVLLPLIKTHYPQADRVVGVSEDITSELIADHGLNEDLCTTIPNPIDTDRITTAAEESVAHPWFSESTPVILGVGRLIQLKHFSVLLQALKKMRQCVEARLVLLGRGPRRDRLVEQADEIGLQDHVDFLGFVNNPFKYMGRADLLVHPPQHEGFGLVIVEALACGTPVVATDCPGGPSDILDEGKYGKLVNVGDPHGLSEAIIQTLENPPDPSRLVERAKDFDVGRIADLYEDLILRN